MHVLKQCSRPFKKSLSKSLILIVLMNATLLAQGSRVQPSESWIQFLEQEPTSSAVSVGSLEALRAVALGNNSQLRVLYADWQMKLESVKTVVSLPDPVLAAGYFSEPVETAQGPQVAKLSLTQTIPWPGKIRTLAHTKQSQAEQAYQELVDAGLVVIRDIDVLTADAAYTLAARKLITHKLGLSQDLDAILESRYKSSSVAHAEYAEARIQTLAMQEALHDLEDEYARIMIKLLALTEANIQITDSVFQQIDPPELREQTIERSDGSHPRMAALEDLAQGNRARDAQARADFFPDLRLGLDYIITDPKISGGSEVAGTGRDPLMVSLGLALPLWNWGAKQAELRSTHWETRKIEALRQQETFHEQQAVELARSTLAGDLRKISLYRDELIPQSVEIIQVMELAYKMDAVSVKRYTQAQLKLIDLELELLKSEHSARIQSALLRYWKG